MRIKNRSGVYEVKPVRSEIGGKGKVSKEKEIIYLPKQSVNYLKREEPDDVSYIIELDDDDVVLINSDRYRALVEGDQMLYELKKIKSLQPVLEKGIINRELVLKAEEILKKSGLSSTMSLKELLVNLVENYGFQFHSSLKVSNRISVGLQVYNLLKSMGKV